MLITDGLEECGGDPCAASKALQDKKVTLQPYIIGIGLTDKMMKEFDCVGKNYNPKTEKDFGTVVSGVISEALDNTTVQVNLLNEKKIPAVTNVPMVFSAIGNSKGTSSMIHTLDKTGQPDTFGLDPNYSYTLRVFTLPPLEKKNIALQMAHHNTITMDASQGFLAVNSTSFEYNNVPCLVRRHGSSDIINVQSLNTSQKYLSGNYDLEILVMPKIKVKNVQVSGAEANRISVPDPGKLEITYKGDETIGSVYVLRDQKQEWLFDFDGSLAIRREVYLLQPGKYIAVYRPAKSTTILDTHTENFSISSGSMAQLRTE